MPHATRRPHSTERENIMRMQTRRKATLALCAAICTLGLGISATAQDGKPRIITFDATGAAPWGTTQPQAINPAGVITGFYFDENAVAHGFVRGTDGTFTTFDAPGAGSGAGSYQGTFPTG